MTIQLKIAGVCERDLDLLFLEEFVANDAFRRWFAHRCGVPVPVDGGWFDAQRSVTQSTGESDLELAFDSAAGRVQLLVENKVGASFQADQALRYRARAVTALSQRRAHVVRTILLAPHIYAPVEGNTRGFDHRVTYEEVRRWFASSFADPARRHYKLALLDAAIEKSQLGYQPVADAPVTEFWRAYWMLCQASAPELEMQEPPGKPAGAGFVYFRPAELPKGVEICHKLPHGNVDLQFSGWGHRLNEFALRFSNLIEPEMALARANKSAVIRLKVPMLDTSRPFATQATAAKDGVDAAIHLLKWCRSIGPALLGPPQDRGMSNATA